MMRYPRDVNAWWVVARICHKARYSRKNDSQFCTRSSQNAVNKLGQNQSSSASRPTVHASMHRLLLSVPTDWHISRIYQLRVQLMIAPAFEIARPFGSFWKFIVVYHAAHSFVCHLKRLFNGYTRRSSFRFWPYFTWGAKIRSFGFCKWVGAMFPYRIVTPISRVNETCALFGYQARFRIPGIDIIYYCRCALHSVACVQAATNERQLNPLAASW